MRRLSRLLLPCFLTLAVTAVGAPIASAAPSVTLKVAVPNATVRTVAYGNRAKLTVQLASDDAAVTIGGQHLQLQADEFPYEGSFVTVASATTTAAGATSFQPRPNRNTRYRALWTQPSGSITSSPEKVVYTDFRVVKDTFRFTQSSHVIIDVVLRAQATLDVSKLTAFAYVRFDNSGRFVRVAAKTPITKGALRSWHFDTHPAGAITAKSVQTFVCAKDQPDVFGIGRPGGYAACGRASLTPAQAAFMFNRG